MNSGTFLATVTDAALGHTRNGKVQLAITYGVNTEAGPEAITGYLFFTPKALDMTERTLRVLGWHATEQNWAIDELVQEKAIVGAEASLVIEEEEHDGITRCKVKWVNDPKAPPGLRDAMTPEEARAFADQLRRGLKAQASKPSIGYAAEGDAPF